MLRCYETAGVTADFSDTFGPGGSCWWTNQYAADACVAVCKSANKANQAAHPDVRECQQDNPCGAVLNPTCGSYQCTLPDGSAAWCGQDTTGRCGCLLTTPTDPCSSAANPACTAQKCVHSDGTVGACGPDKDGLCTCQAF